MLKHRAALVATLATLACLTASATASAITISPGGSVVSSGSISMRNAIIATTCNLTLNQTLTTGTYSPGQQFGTVNSVSASCSGGVTMTIGGLPAPMFMGDLSGGLMHKLVPITFLISAGSIVRCLYRVRLGANSNGRDLIISSVLMANLDATQSLVTIPLCSTTVGITGTLTLAPAQTVTLP